MVVRKCCRFENLMVREEGEWNGEGGEGMEWYGEGGEGMEW